jgi:uncharacterized protein (DUF2141 family)
VNGKVKGTAVNFARRAVLSFPSLFKPVGCAALLLTLAASIAQAADLTVAITGVRNAKESVRIALYADSESFRHEQKALQVLSVPAAEGTVTGVFHDIPAGRYAILAYHDEDGNQKLNLFLGMFPAEGYGLSNDPTVIGPPRFEASAFDVAEPGTAVSVALHY